MINIYHFITNHFLYYLKLDESHQSMAKKFSTKVVKDYMTQKFLLMSLLFSLWYHQSCYREDLMDKEV